MQSIKLKAIAQFKVRLIAVDSMGAAADAGKQQLSVMSGAVKIAAGYEGKTTQISLPAQPDVIAETDGKKQYHYDLLFQGVDVVNLNWTRNPISVADTLQLKVDGNMIPFDLRYVAGIILRMWIVPQDLEIPKTHTNARETAAVAQALNGYPSFTGVVDRLTFDANSNTLDFDCRDFTAYPLSYKVMEGELDSIPTTDSLRSIIEQMIRRVPGCELWNVHTRGVPEGFSPAQLADDYDSNVKKGIFNKKKQPKGPKPDPVGPVPADMLGAPAGGGGSGSGTLGNPFTEEGWAEMADNIGYLPQSYADWVRQALTTDEYKTKNTASYKAEQTRRKKIAQLKADATMPVEAAERKKNLDAYNALVEDLYSPYSPEETTKAWFRNEDRIEREQNYIGDVLAIKKLATKAGIIAAGEDARLNQVADASIAKYDSELDSVLEGMTIVVPVGGKGKGKGTSKRAPKVLTLSNFIGSFDNMWDAINKLATLMAVVPSIEAFADGSFGIMLYDAGLLYSTGIGKRFIRSFGSEGRTVDLPFRVLIPSEDLATMQVAIETFAGDNIDYVEVYSFDPATGKRIKARWGDITRTTAAKGVNEKKIAAGNPTTGQNVHSFIAPGITDEKHLERLAMASYASIKSKTVKVKLSTNQPWSAGGGMNDMDLLSCAPGCGFALIFAHFDAYGQRHTVESTLAARGMPPQEIKKFMTVAAQVQFNTLFQTEQITHKLSSGEYDCSIDLCTFLNDSHVGTIEVDRSWEKAVEEAE